MATPAIVIDKLSKRYPGTDQYALQDLSLTVEPGEVYGFLGANGAGKTTTIRLLLNFIQPSSGSAQIIGRDIVKDYVEVKRTVGYLSGEIALYPKATAAQLFGYLNSLQPPKNPIFVEELTRRFEVDLDKPIETLSKGNRQKVGLLQAFMHEPDVLILDEPTSGLDPLMQEEFFKLVAECKARGAAIFLSSHNLAEAQRICDRVGIIKHGKLIREQRIEDAESLQSVTYRVVLKSASDSVKLSKDSHVHVIETINDTTLLVKPQKSLQQLLSALSKYPVVEVISQQPDLENEFIEYYGDGA